MATFTGPDLERALNDGPLAETTTTLTGMVKASETKGHVAFTRAGCEQWVDLPTDLIAEAETLGQQTCRDHSHPVVKLTLSVGDDPAARLLASLIAQQAAPPPAAVGMGASALTAPPPGYDSFVPAAPVAHGAAGGLAAPQAAGLTTRRGPLGGMGGMGGGGLNAWGCWTGSCCIAGRWVAGPIGRMWVCDLYEDCERCIWPY